MGYIIEWDNSEQTVVLQQYIDPASKDDLYVLAEKSAEMLHTVSHTVHLIIDERAINLVLNSADMRYLEKMVPDNQGAVVVVVNETVMKYKTLVHELGKTVAPHAFGEPYFAQSIEDARDFLSRTFGVDYSVDSRSK